MAHSRDSHPWASDPSVTRAREEEEPARPAHHVIAAATGSFPSREGMGADGDWPWWYVVTRMRRISSSPLERERDASIRAAVT